MNALTNAPTPGGPTRTERRLLDGAKEHLGDEQVLAVVRGQTLVSPIILPLIGPLLFLFNVKPRTVIVTDKSVVTVQESIWMQSSVVRLVSRYHCGSVLIQLTRLGLKIGDDKRIFAMRGSLPAMKQAAVLGSCAGA